MRTGRRNPDEEYADMKRDLRNARKAVRMLAKAEWMVTCDWAMPAQRNELWREVAKLARVRV